MTYSCSWMLFLQLSESGVIVRRRFILRADNSDCCSNVAILDFRGDGGSQGCVFILFPPRQSFSVVIYMSQTRKGFYPLLNDRCQVVPFPPSGWLPQDVDTEAEQGRPRSEVIGRFNDEVQYLGQRGTACRSCRFRDMFDDGEFN